MPKPTEQHLSRRERQIMDVIYRFGEATAADVAGQIPDPPSYSAVRAMLAILEDKGHLRHRTEGTKYVYAPTRPRDRAAKLALAGVVRTFFDGSPEKAVAALLDVPGDKLSQDELDRLAKLIDEARKEGR